MQIHICICMYMYTGLPERKGYSGSNDMLTTVTPSIVLGGGLLCVL